MVEFNTESFLQPCAQMKDGMLFHEFTLDTIETEYEVEGKQMGWRPG